MLSRIPWPRIVCFALYAVAAVCCLLALAILGDTRLRWPSGPYAMDRLRSLLDFSAAITCLGVSAAAFVRNAQRISRGETLWRAPAALAGGVGVYVAVLSAWLIGEIALGLVRGPQSSYDQTWLLVVGLAPFLTMTAAIGWLLLVVGFGQKPPAASNAIRLLSTAIIGGALASGLVVLPAAAQGKDAAKLIMIGAPMALGLLGLAAAVAIRRQERWLSMLQTCAGFLIGALCTTFLSLAVSGFFDAHDPRAAFLYAIFMVPICFALVGGYGLGVLIAAGRVAVSGERLRRIFA